MRFTSGGSARPLRSLSAGTLCVSAAFAAGVEAGAAVWEDGAAVFLSVVDTLVSRAAGACFAAGLIARATNSS